MEPPFFSDFPCLLGERIPTDAEDDWGKEPTYSRYFCRNPETRDNPATQGTTALLLWASISLQHNSSLSSSFPLGSPNTWQFSACSCPQFISSESTVNCWTAAADCRAAHYSS